MPGRDSSISSIIKLSILLSLSALGAVATVSATFAMVFEVSDEDAPAAIVVPVSSEAGATVYDGGRPLGGVYEEPPPLDLIETIWMLSSSMSVQPERPTMLEILLAADALVKAGVMEPPEPSINEVLVAVDQLSRANALPGQEPPLSEVLRAVSILIDAGELDPSPAAPPAAPIEQPRVQAPVAPAPPPPPPPAPTSTPVPAPQPQPAGDGGWLDAAFAARVIELVNAERAERGLQTIAFEPRLTRAAENYAVQLTVEDWFSHVGPDGSTVVDRVVAQGFPFDTQIGEVLAWGADWSPEGIVQAWMDSPSHQEQLLEPVYARAGVGCYFRVEEPNVAVRCVVDFAG